MRERFLTLLFALARLRQVERSALVDFHACHKYLLLAYEETGMREMGRIVAEVAERPWPETLALYRERFARAFACPARVVAHINALQCRAAPEPALRARLAASPPLRPRRGARYAEAPGAGAAYSAAA